MTSKQATIDDYVLAPAKHFKSPQEVVDSTELDQEDKNKILIAWKQEELQLQKASEENMTGPEPGRLAKVEQALIDVADRNR